MTLHSSEFTRAMYQAAMEVKRMMSAVDSTVMTTLYLTLFQNG